MIIVLPAFYIPTTFDSRTHCPNMEGGWLASSTLKINTQKEDEARKRKTGAHHQEKEYVWYCFVRATKGL